MNGERRGEEQPLAAASSPACMQKGRGDGPKRGRMFVDAALYGVVQGLTRLIAHAFFREVTVINPERIPAYGPVIFVGNHNNQFVDASMLVAILPRRLRFLIAEVSMNRPIIGALARAVGCIAVARPQDKAFGGIGRVELTEDAVARGGREARPCRVVRGYDTRFHLDLGVGDRVESAGFACTVEEIMSDAEFVAGNVEERGGVEPGPDDASGDGDGSEGGSEGSGGASAGSAAGSAGSSAESLLGSPFRVLPRVDQSDVYQAVSESLSVGEAICIFPEGGSHDQLNLLPLKPGVAIMALQAAIQGVEDVMVVPVGLNYYQAHKILSRATVQIGNPFVVREDLVQLYHTDRRAAVTRLLEEIQKNLGNCIISAPDYQSLKAVRTSVTLYVPESSVLPPDKYHTIYHLFSVLTNRHIRDPEMQAYLADVQNYLAILKSYGIADHEVQQLRMSVEEIARSFSKLVLNLLWSVVIAFPICFLWAPIRGISSALAEKARKEALAASKVKIMGRDVVASKKILVMIVLLPLTNFLYSFIYGMFFCKTWTGVLTAMVVGFFLLPFLYFHSLRQFAKISMLLRRFKFCFLAFVCKLNAWRDTEREIITQRMRMQLKIRRLVQKLSPECGAEFKSTLETCVPNVVVQIDSKRIERRLENGEFVPIVGGGLLESREEIL